MYTNAKLQNNARLAEAYELWISADVNTQSILLPPNVDCEPALVGSIATYQALLNWHEKEGNTFVLEFCEQMIVLLQNELANQYF